MSNTISIPPIVGEYTSLRKLSEFAGIPYSTLFYYQNNFSLLPSFRLQGLKDERYNKSESLLYISAFQKLSERMSLEDAKQELLKNKSYMMLVSSAKKHNNIIKQS